MITATPAEQITAPSHPNGPAETRPAPYPGQRSRDEHSATRAKMRVWLPCSLTAGWGLCSGADHAAAQHRRISTEA